MKKRVLTFSAHHKISYEPVQTFVKVSPRDDSESDPTNLARDTEGNVKQNESPPAFEGGLLRRVHVDEKDPITKVEGEEECGWGQI